MQKVEVANKAGASALPPVGWAAGPPGGEGVLPTMAYTGRLRPKRGTFFRFQVYKRVGIYQVEV